LTEKGGLIKVRQTEEGRRGRNRRAGEKKGALLQLVASKKREVRRGKKRVLEREIGGGSNGNLERGGER